MEISIYCSNELIYYVKIVLLEKYNSQNIVVTDRSKAINIIVEQADYYYNFFVTSSPCFLELSYFTEYVSN